ncbi:type II toxin-antitoxin system SpoIISA family toxin [Jeotgalibacillus malaysiensis]|uniref:type II toxin-antitoxin system SpoIISA family toxin n=1 Tax=Jeotgalibacillus malaysiensis TaxID=1508404 RepID=UPI0038508CA6
MGLIIWTLVVLLFLLYFFVYELIKERKILRPEFTGEARWEIFKRQSRQKNFRRGLYLIFIVGAAIWLIFYGFTAEDWNLLLLAAASVVFIDISIFSTPRIKKIWNTEFDLDEIEAYRSDADDTVTRLTAKASHFALVHENIPANSKHIDSDTDILDFVHDVLQSYLSRFGLLAHIYEFYEAADRKTEEFDYQIYEEDLIGVLEDIASTFSLSFEDQDFLSDAYDEFINKFQATNLPIQAEPSMNKMISNLLLNENYTLTLFSSNRSYMLTPTFLNRRLYLTLIVCQYGEIDTLDGSLVPQLVQTTLQHYEWGAQTGVN